MTDDLEYLVGKEHCFTKWFINASCILENWSKMNICVVKDGRLRH